MMLGLLPIEEWRFKQNPAYEVIFMHQVIYKYPIRSHIEIVDMPRVVMPLSVGLDAFGAQCLWALCNIDGDEFRSRTIFACGTGYELNPAIMRDFTFVGRVQNDDRTVIHHIFLSEAGIKVSHKSLFTDKTFGEAFR